MNWWPVQWPVHINRKPKVCWTWENKMTEWSSGGLLPRIHPIPDSTALHQDDRMMTVLTKWRSRQTEHVTRSHVALDLFETERGKVVALIDDHLSIFGYNVVHHALAIQALEK